MNTKIKWSSLNKIVEEISNASFTLYDAIYQVDPKSPDLEILSQIKTNANMLLNHKNTMTASLAHTTLLSIPSKISKLSILQEVDSGTLTSQIFSILKTKGTELEELASDFFGPLSTTQTLENDNITWFQKSAADQEQHLQNLNKKINDTELKSSNLELKIRDLEKHATEKLNTITDLYDETSKRLNEKEIEIDRIVGHLAGRAVAGDYQSSAGDEKKSADWLRLSALACMGVIVVLLGASLFETISTDFDWKRTLTRVSLVFLLSIPAAYLARESAKHRQQQYQHHQTSLDMKAIAPFIASLPMDEQHKIKAAIATKLFAGRDFSKVSNDPFPINSHELIMELVKKIDTFKPDKSPQP
ncbi:hypothetical protein MXL15_01970 [Pseudomonas mosselii]|uniref:hypothetical protein n=1 Tax=Pseudomonas mosselii TaxID=78327 RepID=UPI002DBFDF26|nr:hypothetical protein [Pseudomonas mosselii]MEB5930968.1 hypothetical protein [Pseudomonas mosselii]